MRGCILSAILLVLLVGNGYAVWQIHLMRADLHALREERFGDAANEQVALAEYARDAAEAIGRGEIERAKQSLKRMDELLEEKRERAGEYRQLLTRQLEAAQDAVASGGAKASEEIEKLVGIVSREPESEDSE